MPGSWESVFREQALLAPFPLGGGRVPPGALSPSPTHQQLQVEEKKCYRASKTNEPTNKSPFNRLRKRLDSLAQTELGLSCSLHSNQLEITCTKVLGLWVKCIGRQGFHQASLFFELPVCNILSNGICPLGVSMMKTLAVQSCLNHMLLFSGLSIPTSNAFPHRPECSFRGSDSGLACSLAPSVGKVAR